MKEIIKMLVVLTTICIVCGVGLALVKDGTEAQIREQVLLNVQGPAVNSVLKGSDNDLIKDSREITVGDQKIVLFTGKKKGIPWAYAYEVFATGFGGDIGVIVGFDINKPVLTGIGVTMCKETAGLGSLIKEPGFQDPFRNKALTTNFKVKKDDGVIDAISGATISSRGVCDAVQKAIDLSKDVKSKI